MKVSLHGGKAETRKKTVAACDSVMVTSDVIWDVRIILSVLRATTESKDCSQCAFTLILLALALPPVKTAFY